MRYVYNCARCGVRHESEQALPTVGPVFVCDSCQRDYGPKPPATMAEWHLFLQANPTARP